ncbi:hypothetical protein DRJ17_05740 [Candidatus Woesearchaeota archaeon]|nr:MAG: hypothetical protein DRJ17_05740 [Candidatus Woesearchaeota archaeon]
MLNKSMYYRLERLYTSQVEPRIPQSIYEVQRTAMVLAGRTRLTPGEKEACIEVFKVLKEKGE